MSPQISLHELYHMQQEKKKARQLCFDKLVELCHRRIRMVAANGGMNTFYEVPGMLLGYPLYNLYECTEYLVETLRGTGFLVQILPPPHVCVIYVSWNPDEVHAAKRMAGGGAPKKRLMSSAPSAAKPMVSKTDLPLLRF